MTELPTAAQLRHWAADAEGEALGDIARFLNTLADQRDEIVAATFAVAWIDSEHGGSLSSQDGEWQFHTFAGDCPAWADTLPAAVAALRAKIEVER